MFGRAFWAAGSSNKLAIPTRNCQDRVHAWSWMIRSGFDCEHSSIMANEAAGSTHEELSMMKRSMTLTNRSVRISESSPCHQKMRGKSELRWANTVLRKRPVTRPVRWKAICSQQTDFRPSARWQCAVIQARRLGCGVARSIPTRIARQACSRVKSRTAAELAINAPSVSE